MRIAVPYKETEERTNEELEEDTLLQPYEDTERTNDRTWRWTHSSSFMRTQRGPMIGPGGGHTPPAL